jgi:hypothetical protein
MDKTRAEVRQRRLEALRKANEETKESVIKDGIDTAARDLEDAKEGHIRAVQDNDARQRWANRIQYNSEIDFVKDEEKRQQQDKEEIRRMRIAEFKKHADHNYFQPLERAKSIALKATIRECSNSPKRHHNEVTHNMAKLSLGSNERRRDSKVYSTQSRFVSQDAANCHDIFTMFQCNQLERDCATAEEAAEILAESAEERERLMTYKGLKDVCGDVRADDEMLGGLNKIWRDEDLLEATAGKRGSTCEHCTCPAKGALNGLQSCCSFHCFLNKCLCDECSKRREQYPYVTQRQMKLLKGCRKRWCEMNRKNKKDALQAQIALCAASHRGRIGTRGINWFIGSGDACMPCCRDAFRSFYRLDPKKKLGTATITRILSKNRNPIWSDEQCGVTPKLMRQKQGDLSRSELGMVNARVVEKDEMLCAYLKVEFDLIGGTENALKTTVCHHFYPDSSFLKLIDQISSQLA